MGGLSQRGHGANEAQSMPPSGAGGGASVAQPQAADPAQAWPPRGSAHRERGEKVWLHPAAPSSLLGKLSEFPGWVRLWPTTVCLTFQSRGYSEFTAFKVTDGVQSLLTRGKHMVPILKTEDTVAGLRI